MITLRNFLKLLPFIGTAALVKHDNKRTVNVVLKDPPPPINKRAIFSVEGIDFEMFVTDQILIPVDGDFYMNVYGTFNKVCGQAIIRHPIEPKSKILRFEGPIFERKDLNERWVLDTRWIIEQAQEMRAKGMFDYITKVPITIIAPNV